MAHYPAPVHPDNVTSVAKRTPVLKRPAPGAATKQFKVDKVTPPPLAGANSYRAATGKTPPASTVKWK